MAMSLEQTDHFLRHVKMHADEVKLGTFKKDKEDYLKKLKEAQKVGLEMSHDMIYILRVRKFKGYENADFSFNIKFFFRIYHCYHTCQYYIYQHKNCTDDSVCKNSSNNCQQSCRDNAYRPNKVTLSPCIIIMHTPNSPNSYYRIFLCLSHKISQDNKHNST